MTDKLETVPEVVEDKYGSPIKVGTNVEYWDKEGEFVQGPVDSIYRGSEDNVLRISVNNQYRVHRPFETWTPEPYEVTVMTQGVPLIRSNSF